MKKLLTFIFILCTVALFAEMRGGAQYDPGAARSNLTNITSGSALGVANGGTGKTTAAEALAALGGASLNGSSTVAFNASTINGVAPLTAAEKTQALVGSTTVGFSASTYTGAGNFSNVVATGFSQGHWVRYVSVASGTTADVDALFPGSTQRGKMTIVEATNGAVYADFLVTASTVEVVAGTANIGATKDAASSANLYLESDVLTLQNNLPTSRLFIIVLTGRSL